MGVAGTPPPGLRRAAEPTKCGLRRRQYEQALSLARSALASSPNDVRILTLEAIAWSEPAGAAPSRMRACDRRERAGLRNGRLQRPAKASRFLAATQRTGASRTATSVTSWRRASSWQSRIPAPWRRTRSGRGGKGSLPGTRRAPRQYVDFASLCVTHRSCDAGITMIDAGLGHAPQSAALYLARGVLDVQGGLTTGRTPTSPPGNGWTRGGGTARSRRPCRRYSSR